MTRRRKYVQKIFTLQLQKSLHIFNTARDENLFLKMAREQKSLATPV